MLIFQGSQCHVHHQVVQIGEFGGFYTKCRAAVRKPLKLAEPWAWRRADGDRWWLIIRVEALVIRIMLMPGWVTPSCATAGRANRGRRGLLPRLWGGPGRSSASHDGVLCGLRDLQEAGPGRVGSPEGLCSRPDDSVGRWAGLHTRRHHQGTPAGMSLLHNRRTCHPCPFSHQTDRYMV